MKVRESGKGQRKVIRRIEKGQRKCSKKPAIYRDECTPDFDFRIGSLVA
jgi:hypothetical protein